MNTSEVAPRPRLEFGQLHECANCHRRKAEPGAKRCPDCLTIGRMVRRYGNELERMYRKWCNDKPLPPPGPFMADDDDYQTFKTRDELMRAYDRWLS